jgi:hypothetical protein
MERFISTDRCSNRCTTNLSSGHKRERLVAEFGEKGFDYAGHGYRDRGVWRAARQAVLVPPTLRLLNAESKTSEIDRVQ